MRNELEHDQAAELAASQPTRRASLARKSAEVPNDAMAKSEMAKASDNKHLYCVVRFTTDDQ